MNAKFVTFTHRPRLYGVSSAMLDLPYTKISFCDYQSRDLNQIIPDILNIEADWLIHIDEDAFVFAPERIQNLLDYMASQHFAVCGVPDGGVVEHRRHNPVACNPFFTILNRRVIIESRESISEIIATAWEDSYRHYTAPFVGADGKKFAYDYFEPYYGFYFWFCKQGFKILYLDAAAWDDEPERWSTLLKDHTGEYFLLHTWWAREYNGSHQARIDRAMRHALQLRENRSTA